MQRLDSQITREVAGGYLPVPGCIPTLKVWLSSRLNALCGDAAISAPFIRILSHAACGLCGASDHFKGNPMSQIVYIIGAIVIILAVLSFVGLA